MQVGSDFVSLAGVGNLTKLDVGPVPYLPYRCHGSTDLRLIDVLTLSGPQRYGSRLCVASGDGTESQGMDPKRVPSNGSSTSTK